MEQGARVRGGSSTECLVMLLGLYNPGTELQSGYAADLNSQTLGMKGKASALLT